MIKYVILYKYYYQKEDIEMKICWDELEKVRYSKRTGKWYVGNNTYVYKDNCTGCGESFLQAISNKGTTCSPGCRRKGMTHTDESKQKISESRKGKCVGSDNGMYGRKHTEESKIRMSEARRNKTSGRNHYRWVGGIRDAYGYTPYISHHKTLRKYGEDVRQSSSNNLILEVRCFKCKEWFIPMYWQVRNRLGAIRGTDGYRGSQHFYCSDKCKHSCSVYGKTAEQLMKEDAVRYGRLEWIDIDREVQPSLRQMVLERDEYKCVKCGKDNNLQCHHIMPVNIEPLLSADVDNCITYCIDCHKESHKKDGCGYGQLHIEVC
jgi:hypothetical protein